VLVADANGSSRTRRADQFKARGFRVALARTPFEAIVKASCLTPDLIVIGASLGDEAVGETAELLASCPATSHIPLVRLPSGRRLLSRIFAIARR
jgi:hypothetical protein